VNDTVLDNGGDVWTLVQHSGGFIHYAVFRRHKGAAGGNWEYTIQFSKKTGGFSREMPAAAKTAREEWNTLVAAGWSRTHWQQRQNRSVAPQQVASQKKKKNWYTNPNATMNPNNYALEA